MNSEELEQSLRTEFESYLKNVTAEMRQEVSEFQKKVEAELEKHRSQISDVFQDFYGRFAADKQVDEAFRETVVEHLRLARDEGARITATAIAEAEELQKEEAVAAVDSSAAIADIRDAIRDISTKNTQSAILKSLVSHASKFTPRGAFFIIKNEHLVGWRVFGTEGSLDDKTVREVFFPVSNDTLLSQAVKDLKTVDGAYGTHADDSIYLSRLQFGQPDRMYAVPLVVRERAVAVLYADYGSENSKVNIEALETLVEVAGLTVELSASARAVKQPETVEQPAAQTVENEEPAPTPTVENSFDYTESRTETPSSFVSSFEPAVETKSDFESNYQFSEPVESVEENYATTSFEESVEPEYKEVESDSFGFSPTYEEPSGYAPIEPEPTMKETSFEAEESQPIEETPQFESAPAWSETVETNDFYSSEPAASFETPSYETFESSSFETVTEIPAVENDFSSASAGEYEFESVAAPTTSPIEIEQPVQTFETPSFETTPAFNAEDYVATNGQNFGAVENGKAESFVEVPPVEVETPVVAAQTSRTRLSERNVDLPIEVSDDERRLHNDARRFARLLVSEIKLYNEQKVKEGRDSSDLYERLREAIDRSREMYDKRVQPPVAAKFDYFHYELVSNLAEGDSNKLGASYPGANA